MPRAHTPDKRTNVQADEPPPNAAKAKRALFIVITDYPGGAERVTFSLAAELATRSGWEVEVKIVCSKLTDSFSERVLPPSVRVSYGPAQNWFLAFPLLPFRLMFRRYDLVFTTHVYTNALLSLLRRMRLVRTGRLVLRESTSPFDRFSGARASRFRFLYRAYGEEDLIIAQTGYMAEHVEAVVTRSVGSAARCAAESRQHENDRVRRGQPLEPTLRQCLEGHRNVLFCGRLIDCKQPQIALQLSESPLKMTNWRSWYSWEPDRSRAVYGSRRPKRGLPIVSSSSAFGRTRSRSWPPASMGLSPRSTKDFPNVVVEMMACEMHKIIVTPCAGDLEKLPAVTVTHAFGGEEIAEALKAAVDGENCSEVYRDFAATRSVSAYLDAVLRLA